MFKDRTWVDRRRGNGYTTDMVITKETRVIGYVRVSTDQQADRGVSLDVQRARLESYAHAMGLTLVGIETDVALSAKSLDRPALQAALAMLERGEADGLLVVKLDRLTRRVADLGYLIERYFEGRGRARWALLSVGDSIDTRSAAGRLCLHMLASVAQWEREAIGERTRDALAELRRQGISTGPSAFGARHTAELDQHGRRVIAPVESERATLARMVELRASGLTLREVAAALTAEGHASREGRAWGHTSVRNALRRLDAVAGQSQPI